MGRELQCEKPPSRIVSLVPSLTELLVDMGLGDRIVGVTKFCVHPQEIKKQATIIGGTKTLKNEVIIGLQPDLIIANKEENNKAQVDELCEHYTVYITDIKSTIDTLEFVSDLESIFNIATGIKESISQSLPEAIFNNESVLYFIWKNPWMSIGGDTYIHHILEYLGLRNVLGDQLRYPELNLSTVDRRIDYIFLSSEPFPFKEEHKLELEKLFPKAKVLLVDGEAFSWYGSRILHLDHYFQSLIS